MKTKASAPINATAQPQSASQDIGSAKLDRDPAVELARPHMPFFSSLCKLRFRDMSIVHRLYMCVGITFFLFFVATFVVFFMTQSQVNSMDDTRTDLSSVLRHSERISSGVISLETAVHEMIQENKQGSLAEAGVTSALQSLHTDFNNLTRSVEALQTGQLKQKLQSSLPNLRTLLQHMERSSHEILALYLTNPEQAARVAYEQSSSYSTPALYHVRQVNNEINARVMERQNATNTVMRWIQYMLFIGLGISLCVIILTNITIRHSLRHDTGVLLKRLLAMAKGDLRSQVGLHAKDEIGSIGRLVDYVVDNTNVTLQVMQNDVDKLYEMVNTNRKSIDATNEAISVQRNTAQNVAEATAQMESSVEKVTEFARSTLNEVKSAEEASDTCRRTMQDNITTTHTLSDRLRASSEAINKIHMMSSQIESIVKTIADIADQTNLLALNATIESARAGESGRGFAIVAEEVRELAIKTAKSTQEVSNTISLLEQAVTNSVNVMAACEGEMDNSLQQSSRANSSIEEIMGIIATISDMSEQIVQSCQQQTSAASEINQSIAHISRLAEDSYDQMSELQSNMHTLNDLATNQAQVLGKFQLKAVNTAASSSDANTAASAASAANAASAGGDHSA